MHLGPKYKIAKRLGAAVFEKTQTQKFQLSEARGGKTRRFGAKSEFARQLLEKQKVRFAYYVNERQFKNYVKKAVDRGGANPAETLFISLETRLDNVMYRMGVAPTRQAARQMVAHGHILVNGRRSTVPSQAVSKGDVLTVRQGSRPSPLFTVLPEKFKEFKTPSWLSFQVDTMEGKVVELPKYERAEHFFDLQPVLEFYSR